MKILKKSSTLKFSFCMLIHNYTALEEKKKFKIFSSENIEQNLDLIYGERRIGESPHWWYIPKYHYKHLHKLPIVQDFLLCNDH